MAKIGRPIKFVIRLTPEERTRLDGMIQCGKGSVNSALKARILLTPSSAFSRQIGAILLILNR